MFYPLDVECLLCLLEGWIQVLILILKFHGRLLLFSTCYIKTLSWFKFVTHCGWHILCSSMINKCCSLLIFMEVGSTVGSIHRLQLKCNGTYICNVAGIFIQGHVMQNACIPVLLVTPFIEVSILGIIWAYLSHFSTQSNWHMWHLTGIFVVGTYMAIAC